MVSVWEMGRYFANLGIIPGSTWIASWNALPQIEDEVRHTAQLMCGLEPIILVGHSLGATTVMNAALDLSNIQIALLVTMDIANFAGDLRKETKPHNVVKQINFISDNSPKNQAEKIVLGVPDVVAGAENRTIAGSIHTTLDNQDLDPEKKYRNPVWTITERSIRSLSSGNK